MKPTRPARSAKRSVISDETCRRCAGQTNLTVDGVCCQRVDGYGRPSSLNQPPVTPMKINGGKFLEQNLEIGWPGPPHFLEKIKQPMSIQHLSWILANGLCLKRLHTRGLLKSNSLRKGLQITDFCRKQLRTDAFVYKFYVKHMSRFFYKTTK